MRVLLLQALIQYIQVYIICICSILTALALASTAYVLICVMRCIKRWCFFVYSAVISWRLVNIVYICLITSTHYNTTDDRKSANRRAERLAITASVNSGV